MDIDLYKLPIYCIIWGLLLALHQDVYFWCLKEWWKCAYLHKDRVLLGFRTAVQFYQVCETCLFHKEIFVAYTFRYRAILFRTPRPVLLLSFFLYVGVIYLFYSLCLITFLSLGENVNKYREDGLSNVSEICILCKTFNKVGDRWILRETSIERRKPFAINV